MAKKTKRRKTTIAVLDPELEEGTNDNESDETTQESKAYGMAGNNPNGKAAGTISQDDVEDMQEEIKVRRRYDNEMKVLLKYLAKAKENRAHWTKEVSESQKEIEELCEKITCIQNDLRLPLFELSRPANEEASSQASEADDIHELIKDVSTLRANYDIEFDFDVFDSISEQYETNGVITDKQEQALIDIAEAVKAIVEPWKITFKW